METKGTAIVSDARPSPAGVIDIPDGALLQGTTFPELQALFKQTWGFPAEAVCLPISTSRKLYFDSSAGYEQRSFPYGDDNDQYELAGIVAVAAESGLDVILATAATAPYTGFGAGNIVDIGGAGSSQSCPWNPDMRALLGGVIGEAVSQCTDALRQSGLQSRLRGLALDVCDLWPMSAEGARIELTCFCRHCREFFRLRGVDLSRFERFPNPWNLCLRDSGTGVGYMGEISSGDEPGALVERSRRRGFLDTYMSFGARSEADLERDADALIRYLRARHAQCVEILADLFAKAIGEHPDPALRRIVVTEGEPWDWTGGTFLRDLDDPAICDELWFDIGEENIRPERVGFRPYMWTRSRYGIDAFFDFVAQTQDVRVMSGTQLGRKNREQLMTMLRDRARAVLFGSIRIRGIAKLVEQSPSYLGLVEPALTTAWVDRFTAGWEPAD